jgi:serine-type anaerobic sulfatase-maturating enzyme
MSIPSPVSIMIKPASAQCNMRCDYCYYYRNCSIYQDSGALRMDSEVLERIIRQYLDMPGTHKPVSWQGGEPLLAGIDFFKKAVELQKEYAREGQVIENNLQTNGLLINDDWGRFFAEEKFLVGTSLDGPEQIHDHYRTDAAGKPTYRRVMRAIEILRKHRVEFNILTVVAKHTVDKPEQLMRFFLDKGFRYMQFIPCVEKEDGRYTDFSITPEEYGDFLCRLFDEYLSTDSPMVYERTLDAVMHSFIGVTPPFCVFGDDCSRLITFEYNGDAFPCDFFVDPEWLLGNIQSDSLADMAAGEKMARFTAGTKKRHSQCSQCPWEFTCHGGCSRYRDMAGGFDSQNYFCKSYKKFFEHAFSKLRSLVDNYPSNRSKIAAMLIDRINRFKPASANNKPAADASGKKPGRNDPCPCGSGKKYKKCCLG